MKTIEEIKQTLKEQLTENRYNHSIDVAEKSKELINNYINCENQEQLIEQCYVAGLLHDCAKQMDKTAQLNYMRKYGEQFVDIANMYGWHGVVGSLIARYEFDIKDCEIIDAIRYHTIPIPKATLVDKVLFISDWIVNVDDERGNIVAYVQRILNENTINDMYVEALRCSMEYAREFADHTRATQYLVALQEATE